jgi:hypothetical protein
VIPETQRKTVPGADLRTGAEGLYADGDVPKDDKLNCVVYTAVDENQSAALKDLLVKRCGAPTKTSELP